MPFASARPFKSKKARLPMTSALPSSDLQALSITPMSGVIGPDSAVTFTVNFKPQEDTVAVDVSGRGRFG